MDRVHAGVSIDRERASDLPCERCVRHNGQGVGKCPGLLSMNHVARALGHMLDKHERHGPMIRWRFKRRKRYEIYATLGRKLFLLKTMEQAPRPHRFLATNVFLFAESITPYTGLNNNIFLKADAKSTPWQFTHIKSTPLYLPHRLRRLHAHLCASSLYDMIHEVISKRS